MSVKQETGNILTGVGKGLSSILFPIQEKGEKPSENLVLHYCEKCKKYHRAE